MNCSLLGSSVHRLSSQEYWSGPPFPSVEDLPNPGFEPGSPALQADSLPSESTGKPKMTIWKKNLKENGYVYMNN